MKRHVIQKPPCGKNVLHNQHGQFSGFYSVIFNLNFQIKAVTFLMWSGTISQIPGQKKVKVPVPLDTVL